MIHDVCEENTGSGNQRVGSNVDTKKRFLSYVLRGKKLEIAHVYSLKCYQIHEGLKYVSHYLANGKNLPSDQSYGLGLGERWE